MAVGTAQGEAGPLPAIQFSERKSAVAVAEVNAASTPGQLAVREFGNLTFILSPANRLQLVDELGRQVSGFDSINDLIIVNWNEIRAGEYKDPYNASIRRHDPNKFTQLADNYAALEPTKSISDCPSELQPFLRVYLKTRGRNNSVPIPEGNWRVGDPSQTHQVVLGSGFILFYEAQYKTFVAYSTVDPQGQPKPPHKWTRFDNKNEYLGDLPEAISKQIKNLETGNKQGVRHIKPLHGFSLIVFEDKITVIKSDNPISQPEFSDNIPMVRENVCIDPQNPQVVYYCSTANPTEVSKLKTEGDPSNWKIKRLPIRGSYPRISSLQLDPSGSFFMFETGNEVVLVEKNSFREIKKLPLKKAIFDKQGRIRGVDQRGHFVVIESNLEQIAGELKKQEIAEMAAGINVQGLFEAPPQTAAEEVVTGIDTEALLPTKLAQEANFLKILTRAQNLGEVNKSAEVLQVLRNQLLGRGFGEAQVAFLTAGMAEAINLRQRVFAQHEAGKLVKALEPRIDPAFVSIATIGQLREDLDRLNAISGFLTPETRNQALILTQRFNQQVGELYRREGDAIQTNINHRVSTIRTKLDKMQTRAELGDWIELDLPAIKQDLAALARESPLEAIEVQKRINAARAEIDRMVKTSEDKLRQEYDRRRGEAQEIVTERGALIAQEIEGFVARMAERQFNTRDAAEQFLAASGTRTLLVNGIAELAKQDPERAKALERELKIRTVTLLGETERAARVRHTGQGELVPFGVTGETTFPMWAAKTAEAATKKRVDLVFLPAEGSLRNNTQPDQIMGDIGVKVIDSTGRIQTLRLFEGEASETDWRLGMQHKGGLPVPSTIMSKDSFLKLRKDSEDWNKPNSTLKAEFGSLRKQLLDHLRKRPRFNQRKERIPGTFKWQALHGYEDDPVWRTELDTLNQKHTQFIVNHHIMFLDRIDQIQKSPLPEAANGKGLVAKWNTAWTRDEYTEEKLEEIARYARMQLSQQKGVIMLRGHAGTGKDVSVDMFSALTKRPLFSYNCSKWTTEEDLTEVLLLDAAEGAPKSVKIPSSVLTGIQTEGAMVYFNEFNALPPPTQLFLHSLADHKRSLMLKTSGGKTIKARQTVLLLGSINEGPLYEGTFPIQPATRDRMTFVNFNYTPLYGEKREGDGNPNPPYSSAGALRVAREVKSLEDFTLEPNMERNEFVKIWDAYINKIDRGVDLSQLTPIQKYDLEVILCLVQWGDKLTQAFAKQADGLASANDLPVMVPLTGRGMSSMAYWLSEEIPDKVKAEGLIPGMETYEKTARSLIERFFLSKFSDEKQKDEIRTAMQGWSSKKRL